MKTYKTLRGIEFDLEVLSYSRDIVHVLATCEEGSNDFDVKLPCNYYDEYDGWVDECDMTEVYQWVDEATASFIAGEAARLCLRNSINNEYHSFNLNTISRFSIEITSMEFENQVIGHVIDHRTAYGEEKIKELLNEIKYNN